MGLRHLLGGIASLFIVCWVTLMTVAGGFRRSFGASDTGPWVGLVPVLVALLVVSSTIWPERRALLHVVALLMGGLCVGCAFLAREAPFVATCSAVFALGWFGFYYRTIWAPTVVQAGR